MSEDEKHTLWHGRFEDGPSKILMDYTASLKFDRRLASDDIAGSKAHVRGLEKVGLLTAEESVDIQKALDQTGSELESDDFVFIDSDEDIHTVIERRVTEIAGDAGAKLHTGRSRNDQVATAFRLWTKRGLQQIAVDVLALQEVLLKRAKDSGNTYMPGYTHLQRAQVVLLSHHLAAHAWSLARDFDRILDCIDRMDISPLGAGALGGSSLPLDPLSVADDLGFKAAFDNSLDAVSDNDFVAEALFVFSMIGIHLSRLGEEFVLWSSEEFSFVVLHDAFSTGSSMLPQKKNPDIAEVARGKSGRLIGNLTGFLATLKSLPLAYNKDLQENKEPLFDSFDQIKLGLQAMAGMIETAEFKTENMQKAADSESLIAIDLAEYLVADGMPFRQAHAIIGGLIRDSLASGSSLSDLVSADENFGEDVSELFKPGASVQRRITPGGAGIDTVKVQLDNLTEQLKSQSMVPFL